MLSASYTGDLTGDSIWHPLKGPLVDWPLAFCDAASVDFDNDTMAGDVVERTKAFENTQVHFNPQQKWYYLKDQLPSELLIFKNADSESTSGATTGRLVCGNQKSRRFLLIYIRSSSRLILQSTGFTNRDATRKHRVSNDSNVVIKDDSFHVSNGISVKGASRERALH